MSINSLDDFMKHGNKAGGHAFLSGWKKKVPPQVNVVMHTGMYPQPVWQHSFPFVFVGQDKQTKKPVTKVFSKRYVCHEEEAVLKRQWFRDENDDRETPPQKCPICKLIEYVRACIANDQLKWTDLIFTFVNPTTKVVTTIHAGGLVGFFNQKEYTDEQKADLAQHGISLKKEWSQNATAKLSYIYSVVDLSDVKKGVQIATESQALKDAIITVVEGAIKSLGPELGNPWRNPYVMQWEHRPNETDFKKQYAAYRIETMPVPPAVLELVRGPAPDLSKDTEPFGALAMRAVMEKHALIEVPWDEIFSTARQLPQEASAANAPATITCSDCGRSGHTPADCPWSACDQCGKEMLLSETVCKSCGKQYAQTAQLPPGTGAAAAELLGQQPQADPVLANEDLGAELDDGDAIPF